jgi:HK97 family phage major capsid protein
MTTSIQPLIDEVGKLAHELRGRVDDLDREQKQLREDLTSKTGQPPPEHQESINKLNDDINRIEDVLKEIKLEEKRPKLAKDTGKMSNDTKAFIKAMKYGSRFNQPGVLTQEELSYVSYDHMPAEQKALYAGDATTGGFFASIDFVNKLKEYQILVSPMRSVCMVMQTSGEKVQFPNLINDASAYYAVEQQSFTDSTDPTLGLLNIPVHELRGLLKLSQQNIEDSMFNLEEFIMKRLSRKFAQREGTAFIKGNGNGQPRGIMAYNGAYSATQAYNATATVTGKQTGLTYIPYIPSGSATTLGQGDCLITALHDLKSYYRPSSTWCFTTGTLGTLRLIKDSQNRPLWQPFAAGGLPSTIYDRPYIEMPDMDEIGANTFPIVIGDFSEGYLIADRIGLNMHQLNELFAVQALVGYIARMRNGGDVLIPECFRTIRIATT